MVALVAVEAPGVGSAVGVVVGFVVDVVEAVGLVGGMEVGAMDDTSNLFCLVFCSLLGACRYDLTSIHWHQWIVPL